MTTTTKTIANLAILDALLVAVGCLVPAVSHIVALPLYMLNPMLAVLLAGMLVGRDWRNSLVLAALLPAVSCLVTGMPTAEKMVCMIAELATVAGVFQLVKGFGLRVKGNKTGVFGALLVAVLAGKLVYYALKAIVIAPVVLIGTAWWIQLGSAVLWCGLFAMLYKRED